MADFNKLKKKTRSAFGDAIPPKEESGNLDAPEIAPVEKEKLPKKSSEKVNSPKIDGRSLRRTGRTELLSVRVSPEKANEFRELAFSKKMKLSEAMEEAISLLTKKLTVNK